MVQQANKTLMIAQIILFCLLLAPSAFSQTDAASKTKSRPDNKKQRRILPESVAIPKGATDVVRNAFAEEITFKSTRPITELAVFYQRFFNERNWHSDDDFDDDDEDIDLDFEKGNRDISVELEFDDETHVVEVTIDGDGLKWKAAKKAMLGFDTDDIPLLDNQARNSDGSLELFQFNSRKPLQENIEHFQNWMKSGNWSLVASEKKNAATLFRFEKDALFIRIGLWPHSFSDNYGKHNGTGGAVTGTGLYWSGRQGVADVPKRMADQAAKLFGLAPAKRTQIINRTRQQIEQVLTGQAGQFRSN